MERRFDKELLLLVEASEEELLDMDLCFCMYMGLTDFPDTSFQDVQGRLVAYPVLKRDNITLPACSWICIQFLELVGEFVSELTVEEGVKPAIQDGNVFDSPRKLLVIVWPGAPPSRS